MGTHYHHITIEERCEMARLQREGLSLGQIAASLDRSTSTVSRELSRNTSRTKGYDPSYAQQQARARRWRGSKLDRDPLLRQWVLGGLCVGWSPQQVAGRLELEAGRSWYPTRPSTALSTPRAIAPRTMPGFGCCPKARPNGAAGAARVIPTPISACASPCPYAPRTRKTAANRVTGRRT